MPAARLDLGLKVKFNEIAPDCLLKRAVMA
jgi:hypothetical protein